MGPFLNSAVCTKKGNMIDGFFSGYKLKCLKRQTVTTADQLKWSRNTFAELTLQFLTQKRLSRNSRSSKISEDILQLNKTRAQTGGAQRKREAIITAESQRLRLNTSYRTRGNSRKQRTLPNSRATFVNTARLQVSLCRFCSRVKIN